MLGVHVSKVSKVLEKSKRKTMLEALKVDCDALGLTAAQIYTHGPRNSRENKMDYEAIRKWSVENEIGLYVHSSYLTVSIWNLNDINKDMPKIKNYIGMLDSQLEACKKLGAKGLVVHFPKKPLTDVINTVQCSAFKQVIIKHDVPILFEMVPVKDKGIVLNKKGTVKHHKGYVTPNQINRFCKKVQLPKRLWGIVIDTAHLWGAGIDPSDKKSQDKWFDEIDNPKMIKLIHLNGSPAKTFASGRDEHIIAFSKSDAVYGKHAEQKTYKKSGVFSIIQFVMKYDLPIICEINRGTEKDVRMSIKLINKLAEECE